MTVYTNGNVTSGSVTSQGPSSGSILLKVYTNGNVTSGSVTSGAFLWKYPDKSLYEWERYLWQRHLLHFSGPSTTTGSVVVISLIIGDLIQRMCHLRTMYNVPTAVVWILFQTITLLLTCAIIEINDRCNCSLFINWISQAHPQDVSLRVNFNSPYTRQWQWVGLWEFRLPKFPTCKPHLIGSSQSTETTSQKETILGYL